MNIKNVLIAFAVILLASGCSTLTPEQRAKRDYETAVAYEARVGYKWTRMWVEEYQKLSLKEYDIRVALWDFRKKESENPGALTPGEKAEYEKLLHAEAKIKSRMAVLKEKLAPALALQSADSYAKYKRDYEMQEGMAEHERISNKRPVGSGAMFPDPKSYNE